MTAVRILHDGGVGEYKAGEVVEKPSAGLLFIAQQGVRNAADGQLVAEVIEDGHTDSLDALRAEAKTLGVTGYARMKEETLVDAIAKAKGE